MKMKKFLAGLAAAVCCLQGASALTGFAEDVTLGDVNLDGEVDIMDVILVNKAIFGKTELNDQQNQNADVNQSGTVDSTDALSIMKYIIHLTNGFDPKDFSFTAVNLSESVKSEEVAGKDADDTFVNAQTTFYLNLFQHAAEKSKGENVLVSPYSAMQALAMTANGADGQTKSEMEQTLGGIALEDLNPYLYTQRISQPNDEKCKLNTANSVWYRNDEDRLKVNDAFLQTNADYYGADAFSAPFDNSTLEDINHWVNEKTDSMIPELLDRIPEAIVMYLINAVAFDAKWATPYASYQVSERDFTAYDGTVQKAQMMYYNEKEPEHYYLKDEHATGFYKYYEGGQYAFAALLPNEDIPIDEYIAGLTPESLHETLANPVAIAVHTGIPKFSYDYSILLNDTLSDMGMPTAFTEAADFTKMAQTASGELYIDYVLQKTHIDLDEAGTKAAAVTVVAMTDESAAFEPQNFETVILDRPFVYCIVDTETYLPVFMGALTSVE